MERKIKAAMIGLTVGASHMTDYLKNPHIGEIVLCDTNPEKIAAVQAKTGLTKSYTDYREMLAVEKPDIVSVCVPNFLHRQIASDAMEAVLQDAEVSCKPEQAIVISSIIDALYKSTETGVPVKL